MASRESRVTVPPTTVRNRKVTIFHGCEKVFDGYFIGGTRASIPQVVEANTKLPPAGNPLSRKGIYDPGTPGWDRNHANDEFISKEPRDDPK